jgi:hypothetical protein
MDSLTKNLFRRGFEAHTQENGFFDGNNPWNTEIPAWGIVYLTVIGLLFMGCMAFISYTYGDVITTLSMIESPSATFYVPTPTVDDSSDAPLESDAKADPELVMVKEKLITSNLRKAEKYLVAQAGSMARFRGVSMALVTHLMGWNLAKFFTYVLPNSFFLSLPISIILSRVVLANFSLGWTHIVISQPSSKYWFRRIPNFSAWKKVARPTLILAAAEQAALFIPIYLATAWGLDKHSPDSTSGNMFLETVQKTMIVGLLSLAATLLVVIPAKVTLTRVQASLLPEDQETIVPFDRSFGGKVVPEIVGGTGMISLLDAWKTFGFHSRIRLIKLYVGIIFIQFFTTIFFAVALIWFFVFLNIKASDTPNGA